MRKTLVLAAAVAALATTAPPAWGGTYDVWSCAGPAGEPLPATGWVASAYWGSTRSSCGTRLGYLSATLPSGQVVPGGYARWTFDAPADTTIDGITIHRAAAASATYPNGWGRSYFLFRDVPALAEGYVGDYCVRILSQCRTPGDPNAPSSDASRYSWRLQAQRIIASAQCDGPKYCEPREFGARGVVNIYRTRISIADAYPPVHRDPPRGSLLDTSAAIQGERSVRFEGTDAGGGLFAAQVIADGTKVAESRIADAGSCRHPFNLPVPCPLHAAGTIALDTAALENGRHRFQVALVDAAGNRTFSDPVSAVVRNAKEPNGTGASRRPGSLRTSAAEVGASDSSDSARAPSLEGGSRTAPALRSEARRFRSILAWTDSASASDTWPTVRTRANGRYRWHTTRGPSRFIRVGYRAYGSDVVDTASAEVKLGVRPRIALKVKPRRVEDRGRITFRGRLVGGPGRGGAQVTIEAMSRDMRSRVPVTTLRTDHHAPLPVLVPLPALVRAVHVSLPRATDAPGVLSVRRRGVADRDRKDRALTYGGNEGDALELACHGQVRAAQRPDQPRTCLHAGDGCSGSEHGLHVPLRTGEARTRPAAAACLDHA